MKIEVSNGEIIDKLNNIRRLNLIKLKIKKNWLTFKKNMIILKRL